MKYYFLLTFVATANAIAYCGATPVFVDSCMDTFLLDTEDLKKVTKKTRAIIAVNLYGNSCNLNEIQNICKENEIYLIETTQNQLEQPIKINYLVILVTSLVLVFMETKLLQLVKGDGVY